METNQFNIRFEPLKLNVKSNDTVSFEGPVPQRVARKLHLIAEREPHILATGDRVGRSRYQLLRDQRAASFTISLQFPSPLPS